MQIVFLINPQLNIKVKCTKNCPPKKIFSIIDVSFKIKLIACSESLHHAEKSNKQKSVALKKIVFSSGMRKLYIETFVFFATFFSPKISHFVRKNKYAKKQMTKIFREKKRNICKK